MFNSSVISGSSPIVETVAPIGSVFVVIAWGVFAFGVAFSHFMQWRKIAKQHSR